MQTPSSHADAARVGSAGFESTHWTVVLEAARQGSAAGHEALETLCKSYWKPIHGFIRRSGHTREESEDLTQGFFEKLVEKNWLRSVTREGGKFRSVLLTAVKHHLSHARERERALKRGGGRVLFSLDADVSGDDSWLEPADNVTPDQVFERRWALGMLEIALQRLRQEYVRLEKADLFDELQVFLSGSARPVPHAEIAARHDISINAVGVAIHRLRRRYGELLREQVARTVGDLSEVENELRHLINVLG